MVTNKDKVLNFGVMARNKLREDFNGSVKEVKIDFSKTDGFIEAKIGKPDQEFSELMEVEEYKLSIKESKLPEEIRNETKFKQTPQEFSAKRGLGSVKGLIAIGAGSAALSLIYTMFVASTSHAPPISLGLGAIALVVAMGSQLLAYLTLSSKIRSIKEKEAEVEEQ